MAYWKGVIEEYRQYLPVTKDTPVITLKEGDTPLIPAPRISAKLGNG
ncbi:MAG TPA: threonine synthase, partial [bacterium]